ncbi:HpcH/HpaI aldolase family protein [Acuticoccus mangrovi]|uniref:HpcH/HpaI aldolase/citrate lyase family protein n=1 Tax=Acuticoccus mangrovi TaxID=2796142 RepID=A0A934MJ44_9HYPH|nr:HpcH/HpaI aldolase/citrate lyase family protein [Acuticoccus mangrovi]MBJ3774224.1 HpcH/HpaI aldolase/citrate lyase family protein [Acuticoccus mangrovi]
MDLKPNIFKAAIARGEPQIGLWCSIGDPLVAEMLAGCGFDWMMFDTEHSPLDSSTITPLLQAVAPYAVSPVVRPASLDPVEIKKLLDCGAQTLLVPFVQSAEEARLAAASVAYPPEGIRGVAGVTRASGFGAIAGYHRRAREEICLLVQIETRTALDALEEIAAVPGVDGVFIGPSDLAASLGFPGEPAHPTVKAAVVDAVKRVRATGKPAGFLNADQTYVAEVMAAGSVFTAVDVDLAILRRGALARAEGWRR